MDMAYASSDQSLSFREIHTYTHTQCYSRFAEVPNINDFIHLYMTISYTLASIEPNDDGYFTFAGDVVDADVVLWLAVGLFTQKLL